MAETLFDRRAHNLRIELTFARSKHFRPRFDEEPVFAISDQFRHRTSSGGDDRRATCHRLDNRKPKGLIEANQMKKRACSAQKSALLLVVDRTQEANLFAVDVWLNRISKVVLVLDDSGNDQR